MIVAKTVEASEVRLFKEIPPSTVLKAVKPRRRLMLRVVFPPEYGILPYLYGADTVSSRYSTVPPRT